MIRINMGLLKNPFVVLGLVAVGLLFLALSSGSSETSLLSERMVDWKSVNLEDEEVKPLAKDILNQIKNYQIVEKSTRGEVSIFWIFASNMKQFYLSIHT